MACGIRSIEATALTAGVLLFAYNNRHIDYVELAAWSADRIHRHLNLPVCLVTNNAIDDARFDHVICTPEPAASLRYFEDLDQTVDWKNSNRSDAYDLSPYESTLILDVDYVVASSNLQQLFLTTQDFLAPTCAFDVTGINSFDELNKFGRAGMPVIWATVMFFKKTPHVKLLFDAVKMVRDNWQHYRSLYQIGRSSFRNDFAFSIAANLVYGQLATWPSLAVSLPSVVPAHMLQQIDSDTFQVQYTTNDGKRRRVDIKDMDFHAMGKRSLGDIVAGT